MIFYFTGTGNTRWAAQQLAGATGDRLRFIPDELRKSTLHYTLADDERLGICFPTHGWQPPHIVREFLRRASFENVHYVYALTTCGDNMGYAIPIDKAEPILEQLMTEETKIAYSEDEQGYLGITAANVTSEYSQMYDMPEGVGITSVVSGGPAEQGGLQKGDIITKIAGTTVSDFDDLQNELRYHKSGETIEITYEHADNGTYKENTANVTLGTKDVLSSINAQNNGNN